MAVSTSTGLGTKTITDIAAGGDLGSGSSYYGRSCAIAGGDVYCWGDNTDRAVNPVSTNYINTPMRMTTTLPSGQMLEVGVGYDMSCAMATANRVWCWGANDWGQLGDGTFTNRSTPSPLAVAGTPVEGKPIEKLTVGVQRGCVLSGGRTYCWGRNDGGQLGDGTMISRPTLVEASFLRNESPNITY